MSRIRILSEHLANQIAAGEVVERPASVVKELLENSIDARASNIEVQVQGSGTRLIRVADNGDGMDGDDVLLCLERHATSKLTEVKELDGISTLGFRGEALPSIGSVANLVILSRPHGSELGTRAEMRYGVLRDVHEAGCAQGTVIEVRNLFGNIPARRKFLKSARTEQYHIEEAVREQALAHPQVRFLLRTEDRVTLEYPGPVDLEKRTRDVCRYREKVIPLDLADGDYRVTGCLLLPETGTPRSAKLRILVNNRPVQDRMLRHAVVEGMQGFLMKGYQPAGVLLLDTAAGQVDVNVHPAKREIRFRQPREVHGVVARATTLAMQGYQESARSALFHCPAPAPASPTQLPPVVQTGESVETEASWSPEEMTRSTGHNFPLPRQAFQGAKEREAPGSAQTPAPVRPLPQETIEPPPPATVYAGLRVIGQFMNLYLLCERQQELVVIDQHAAHERVLYGQLRQGYLESAVPRQQLLFPVSVELGPEESDLVEVQLQELERIGFGLSYFGETTWIIKEVPVPLSQADPGTLLADVLKGLERGAGETGRLVPARVDALLADMACKAAIKAGNRLLPEEMLKLLEQMDQSRVFSHCPHGRPVLKTFGVADIEKWFHRRE